MSSEKTDVDPAWASGVNMVGESHHCSLSKFSIGGIPASIGDFGEGVDTDPPASITDWEDHCGNMEFITKPPTAEVLCKYRITEDQYDYICDLLKGALSFGSCDYCE